MSSAAAETALGPWGRRKDALSDPSKLAINVTSPRTIPRLDGDGISELSVSLIPLEASPGKSGCINAHDQSRDSLAKRRGKDIGNGNSW